MRKIDDLTELGYCGHGYIIIAKHLSKWSRVQLEAAPDLLEACKGLLDMITDNRLHGPEVYLASDAIKKAQKGE